MSISLASFPASCPAPPALDRRLCVAPMMRRTDRHFRRLIRLLSRHAVLYTEMIHCNALLHGRRRQLLAHHPLERPLALQLGGSDPSSLAACARLGEHSGYDEINLNLGCPSRRGRQGDFGACLMAEPGRVADCIAAMCEQTALPVTLKTRIGIDQQDDYPFLLRLIERAAGAGCRSFILHARKAWLRGLSPRQNRQIPPLHYDRVYRLKRDFPQWEFILNGGIEHLEAARAQIGRVDGVMIGRAAYRYPWRLADADRQLFGVRTPAKELPRVLLAYRDYMQAELERGSPLPVILRPLPGLLHGRPGARALRAALRPRRGTPGQAARELDRLLAPVLDTLRRQADGERNESSKAAPAGGTGASRSDR